MDVCNYMWKLPILMTREEKQSATSYQRHMLSLLCYHPSVYNSLSAELEVNIFISHYHGNIAQQ